MEVVHNHTTADAPQTVQYVRKRLYELELQGIPVSITYPMYKGRRESLWSLIPVIGAPTRMSRWCCEICKEHSGVGRAIATGVRWSESYSRKTGRASIEAIGKTKKDKILLNDDAEVEEQQTILSGMVIINGDNDDRRRWQEHCRMRGEICFNPIINWTDADIWGFLAGQEVNPLYGMGFDRVGCVGCPQSQNGRYYDFEVFPAYERMWRKALEKRLVYRKVQGKENLGVWKDIECYWAWWMHKDLDQISFDQLQECVTEFS